MISRKGSFAAGVIAAMVLGSGSAYAATGGSFTLGGKNKATKTSTLINTKGTALKLKSKAGTPPLAVTSGAKVTNLNSDRLDGVSAEQFLRTTGKAADANLLDGLSSEQFLRSTGKAVDAESVDGVDSSALALAAGATSFVVANGVFTDLDGDAIADALIAIATCPAGTKLTGGGVDNFTGDSFGTVINSPNTGSEWDGASFADPSVNAVDDLQAYAVCYNPRGGAAPGSVATLGQAKSHAHATTRSEAAAADLTGLTRLATRR